MASLHLENSEITAKFLGKYLSYQTHTHTHTHLHTYTHPKDYTHTHTLLAIVSYKTPRNKNISILAPTSKVATGYTRTLSHNAVLYERIMLTCVIAHKHD